jgi:hypothetical protein
MTTLHTFKVGDRVRLTQTVDRYPDFVAPAGLAGTVDTVEVDGSLAVKMDQTLDGCEEWNNCICWYDWQLEDVAADLALI